MRLVVDHVTRYSFDPPMRALRQSLRVWPSLFDGQRIEDWRVAVDGPGIARGASFRDGAGDLIETATMRGGVDRAEIHIEGAVETTDLSGLLKGHREKVPPGAYLRPTRLTRQDAALDALSADALSGLSDPLERAHSLARAVTATIIYTPGATESRTTAAEALALGAGVCQDQTHALIAIAQSAGMPARYVTGYLFATADGDAHQASHAWAEVHVEGLGWVGFDPANACCPDAKYIRLGSGHDSVQAAPVRGMAQGGGVETLETSVTVLEAGAARQQ